MNGTCARAVILAAGTSSRIGKQKLLMAFRGAPLLEHTIAAAQAWSPIVVAGSEVATYLCDRSDIVLLRNDRPERGMSHSLRLANDFLPAAYAIVVLLGDKPLVTCSLVETMCQAGPGADVVYPVHDGEPGHPVWISPRARRYIDGLPDGDTLRLLRGRDGLTSRALQTQDAGAVFDVDTIEAFGEPPPVRPGVSRPL